MDDVTISPNPQTRGFYTLPDITARGRFSKSHLYNLINREHFPRPVFRCGTRFTRWGSASVDEWFQDPAGWIKANKSGAA